MPSIVNISKIDKVEIQEYLPNATMHREQWTLGIEDEYPYIAHVLDSDENVRMLKNIRVYIERYGIDDALYHIVNKDYQYCWNVDKAKYM